MPLKDGDVIKNSRRFLDVLEGEKGFQDTVIEYAGSLNWSWWHDTDSRKNHPGMPDLILIRPPRLLFVELKTEKGKYRLFQSAWAVMLGECPGVEYYSWRPSDWEEIEEVLQRWHLVINLRGQSAHVR